MRISSMPSVVLALLLTAGAGLPGLRPSTDAVADISLMALTEIKGG